MTIKDNTVSCSLIKAIKKNNLNSLKNLIFSQDLSHYKDKNGGYLLLFALITLGRTEIAKFFQDVNIDCDLLLQIATKLNAIELVHLLVARNVPIDAQNNQNETALHIAAQKGHTEIAEILLCNNASLTVKTEKGLTPLMLATENGHKEVIRVIGKHTKRKKEEDHASELIIKNVTEGGDSTVIDDLLDRGFTLNPEYVTEFLLRTAVENDYCKLLESIFKNFVSNDKKECKLIVYGKNDDEVVDLLLNSKAREKDNICTEEDKFFQAVLNMFAQGEKIKEAPKLLYSAVQAGMAEIVKLLIACGVEIEKELLHLAVKLSAVYIVKLLIKNGVDVNAFDVDGKTPLHLSCEQIPDDVDVNNGNDGDFDDDFYDETNDDGPNEKDDIVSLLLSAGADVDIKNKDGHTAFHLAVISGRKAAVKIFLDFGVDVDLQAEDGSTPLHWASHGGLSEIVEILCANNANPNACEKNGETVLHWAARGGQSEVVEILCQKKVCIDARENNGWTPLHFAALGGVVAVVRMLLKYNADIDARGPENKTPLHCAYSGNMDIWKRCIIVELLDNGSDINAETAGNTILSLIYADARLKYTERFRKLGFLNRVVTWFQGVNCDFEAYDYLDSEVQKLVLSLREHVIKFKVAGLAVSAKNLKLFASVDCKLADFKNSCEEELRRLKNEDVYRGFTLYDVLVVRNPLYAKNEPVMKVLKCSNFHEFPIYRSFIISKVEKSEMRSEFISVGWECLNILAKTSGKLSTEADPVLPVELGDEIVSYLTNSELKSFVAFGKTLKV